MVYTSHKPSSFTAQCFNQQHSIELSVINGTATQISLDLLSPNSYNCCVLAIYRYGNYVAERKCTSLTTEMLQSNSLTSPVLRLNDRSGIIGGVLGSVMIILLLLLAICGGALLYMLQSKSVILKR